MIKINNLHSVLLNSKGQPGRQSRVSLVVSSYRSALLHIEWQIATETSRNYLLSIKENLGKSNCSDNCR